MVQEKLCQARHVYVQDRELSTRIQERSAQNQEEIARLTAEMKKCQLRGTETHRALCESLDRHGQHTR